MQATATAGCGERQGAAEDGAAAAEASRGKAHGSTTAGVMGVVGAMGEEGGGAGGANEAGGASEAGGRVSGRSRTPPKRLLPTSDPRTVPPWYKREQLQAKEAKEAQDAQEAKAQEAREAQEARVARAAREQAAAPGAPSPPEPPPEPPRKRAKVAGRMQVGDWMQVPVAIFGDAIGVGCWDARVTAVRNDEAELHFATDDKKFWFKLSEARHWLARPPPRPPLPPPPPSSSTTTTSAEGEQQGAQLEGRRVRLWWSGDRNWYRGVVGCYHAQSGRHTVRCEDGGCNSMH